MLLLSFSRPPTPEHLAHVEAPSGQSVQPVVDLPAQFDGLQPFAPRVISLVDATGLTATAADVAGGAALACLSPGRAMQYMASDRDWKGDPIPRGEMKPVLLDVSPTLATAGVPVPASPTEEAP